MADGVGRSADPEVLGNENKVAWQVDVKAEPRPLGEIGHDSAAHRNIILHYVQQRSSRYVLALSPADGSGDVGE